MKRLPAVLVTAVTTCLMLPAPASALQMFVGQQATYRYIFATGAGCDNPVKPANWFAFNFDDSGWNTGQTPFSSGAPAGTFGSDLGNANAPFAPGSTPAIPTSFTQWNVLCDPLVRTAFNLAAPTALTVWIAVDNGIGVGANGMFLNGVQATATVNAEGQAFRWEHVFDIPSQYTFTGPNVFALQLEDHGGATAFMMVVTENDAATHDSFTTNPAPTPPTPPPTSASEPGALALLGLGLAGLGLSRRRQA